MNKNMLKRSAVIVVGLIATLVIVLKTAPELHDHPVSAGTKSAKAR